MTARVIPFKPEHAAYLLVQDSQKLEWHARRKLAHRFADHGTAYTILSQSGRPIFCGGAVELVPVIEGVGGHAQMWALFAADKRHAMPRVLRATRQFIAGLPHLRVDTPVIDRPEAIRWAEMLGLGFDVRLKEAAPLGRDTLIYRRLK